MGYNSTLLILNDGLGDIDRNLESWWGEVKNAIGRSNVQAPGVLPLDIPAGGHGNSSALLAMHHADFQSVLVVGGNYGTVLGQFHRGSAGHHRIGDREELLHKLAAQYGYRLVAP